MKIINLFATLLALTGLHAHASDYSLDGYGGDAPIKGLSQYVGDEITADFKKTFPGKDYVIVVIYDHTRFDNSDICWASVGLAPMIASPNRSLVPQERFNTTLVIHGPKVLDQNEIKNCQLKAIKRALKNMVNTPTSELMSEM